MNCQNCGATLTCSCQKRVASNGTQCCQYCVGDLEREINEARKSRAAAQQNLVAQPIITSANLVYG